MHVGQLRAQGDLLRLMQRELLKDRMGAWQARKESLSEVLDFARDHDIRIHV